MKRIGTHDAFEKWELLCRYWEDRDTAVAIGTDRSDRPLVPKWHRAAVTGGSRVGADYLASRLQSPRPMLAAELIGDPQGSVEPPLEAEIAQLATQFGPGGLQSRYRQLVEAIASSGFQTPLDGGLSPRLAARLRQVFKQGALEALQWTGDDGELPSLPVLRSRSPQYPDAALRHKSNALCMFCSGFYGRSDVIHVHDARPDTVTLVDIDASAMADMKTIYPSHWSYVISDYKEFLAEATRSGWRYDVIAADPNLSMAREVAWDFLPAIMSICSDTFITNYSEEMFNELNVSLADLVGLSQAVSEKTGTEIVFTQIMAKSSPAYWVVMRKQPVEARAQPADALSRRAMPGGSACRDSGSTDEVVVIGPTTRWSEVSPQGSLAFETEAPVLIYPQHRTSIGPSPRLRCGFFGPDNGEPVDIVIEIAGGQGVAYFRFKLGPRRDVDLRKLRIALPAGEARAWAVYRRSPDALWGMYQRVDFRIDPDASDEPTDEATNDGTLHTLAVEGGALAKYTPSEIRAYLDDFLHLEKRGYISRSRRPRIASACVDLDKYDSIESFIEQCRKVHKGNAVRDALKAARLGYYSKFFDFRSYTPDIVAINKSTPSRGGLPMTHYNRTVADYGGYPERIEAEHIPDQAGAWVRRFGVFRQVAGHCQGDVVSDEQLVAHIELRRYGNYAMYSIILGHADHLADGVMYKMHLDLVGLILAARDHPAAESEPLVKCLRGIRFLMYSAYHDIRPGLLQWKKRTLFEPIYTRFDYLADCPVEQLCAVAQQDIENMEWQGQCARMLAEAIERRLDEGRAREAAVARAELATVSKRLAAHAKPVDYGRVVVVGPTKRWSEVLPEGSLDIEGEAPVLTYPQQGMTTGPSPLLRCEFPARDNGEPVDIVIQITGAEGISNFRFKLGTFRDVDLQKFGIALPSGKAEAWAVHRRSLDARLTTYQRIDFRIDPNAPNDPMLV